MPPEVQDLVERRYRLLVELGAGGMGTVWEAEDEKLGRRVAIKTITPRLARDDKALIRFEREAKAVAQLSSPHIIQLLDYGVDECPFMVMELLAGTLLSARLESQPYFLLPTAARLVGQIAKALTTAHRAGIVHRDLKPENIYLVKDNDDEYIKVFDFGTAKALSGFKDAKDITTLGSILGTPDYMAPEQLAGDVDTDHRVDVWSLAVVAFHLITGELPFAGEGMGEVIHGIIFGTHRDPTEINPDLPPDLDAFFDQALHKKREERFQSARALAAALAEIAAIRPSLSMTLDHGSVRSIVEEHDERKAVEQAALSWPGEDGQSVPDVIGPDVFGPDVTGPEPSDAGSVGNGNGSDDLLSTSHLSAQALSRRRPRTPPWDGLPKHVVTGGGVMAVLLGGVVAWLVFGSHGGSEPVAPAQATSSAGAPTPSVERPSSSAMPSASSASSATVTAGSSTTVSGSAAPAKSAPPAATARPTWRPKQDIYEDVDVDY